MSKKSLKLRDHTTLAKAIAELTAHDFYNVHRHDGLYVYAHADGRSYGIARSGGFGPGARWHLNDQYPVDTK